MKDTSDTSRYKIIKNFIKENNQSHIHELSDLIFDLFFSNTEIVFYRCVNIRFGIWYKFNSVEKTFDIIHNFDLELSNILEEISFFHYSLQQNFWYEIKDNDENSISLMENMVNFFKLMIIARNPENFSALVKSCSRKMFQLSFDNDYVPNDVIDYQNFNEHGAEKFMEYKLDKEEIISDRSIEYDQVTNIFENILSEGKLNVSLNENYDAQYDDLTM
jgi:hypothetical protein